MRVRTRLESEYRLYARAYSQICVAAPAPLSSKADIGAASAVAADYIRYGYIMAA
jgi:hypothetical protein